MGRGGEWSGIRFRLPVLAEFRFPVWKENGRRFLCSEKAIEFKVLSFLSFFFLVKNGKMNYATEDFRLLDGERELCIK